jgi:hypothetical protein
MMCKVPTASQLETPFVEHCGLDTWTAEQFSAAIGKSQGRKKHPLGLNSLARFKGQDVCEDAEPAARRTCAIIIEGAMECVQETLRRLGCPPVAQ